MRDAGPLNADLIAYVQVLGGCTGITGTARNLFESLYLNTVFNVFQALSITQWQ
jgi:hypothetical protein